MAYVVGLVPIGLGVFAIVERDRFAAENARWNRTRWPASSDPRVQRVSGFGIALFGVLLVAIGVYVIALGARVLI